MFSLFNLQGALRSSAGLHYITELFKSQELFSSFFKVFLTRIRNARHSQKRSAIISNRIAFVKHYFRLFSTFFVIYHKWYKQR